MSKVCNIEIPEDCESCYLYTLNLSDLIISSGIAANTTYYVWIIDKFGNIFRDQYNTDNNGNFILDEKNYPDNMFNKFSGNFRMFISSDIDGNNIIPMTWYFQNFNCVILNFVC